MGNISLHIVTEFASSSFAISSQLKSSILTLLLTPLPTQNSSSFNSILKVNLGLTALTKIREKVELCSVATIKQVDHRTNCLASGARKHSNTNTHTHSLSLSSWHTNIKIHTTDQSRNTPIQAVPTHTASTQAHTVTGTHTKHAHTVSTLEEYFEGTLNQCI